MIRQTSIEAYNQIKEEGLLSRRSFEVYDSLYSFGPATANELFSQMMLKNKTLDQSNTNVRARLNELREDGTAQELGTKTCSITGRNVILWNVTRNLPIKPKNKLTNSQIIKGLVALVKKNHQWNQRKISINYLSSKLYQQNERTIKYFQKEKQNDRKKS